MWKTLFDKSVRQIIRTGTLVIEFPDGTTRRYGDGTGEPVVVRMKTRDLMRRIVLNADLGVGEGYMNGELEIENDDLYAFMSLAVRNTARGKGFWWHAALDRMRTLLRRAEQWNPAGRAQKNVAHHYDLSGELYDLFLDADKQYSCAYFARPDMTLEEAQAAKKAHIANKLLIEPGMRVLDIGCGWGGMALTLARDHGARVVGVTLSEEQHKVATRRAKEAGLDDRVEFRLTDYRAITERFDRIVSVGMFEHVGTPHYREYFRHVHDKLNDDGVALIHTIGHVGGPNSMNPWMEKYIFPGAYAPALSEITNKIDQQELVIYDIESWRIHYSTTLRHWLDRALNSKEKIIHLYDERFLRMWKYYLTSMEISFKFGNLLVYQIQIGHKLKSAPITRDYLYTDHYRRNEVVQKQAAE